MEPSDADRSTLQLFWLLDGSGSMEEDQKITALHAVVSEAVEHVVTLAGEHPQVEISSRAVVFSDGARWATPAAVGLSAWRLETVTPKGLSDLGAAIDLVSAVIDGPDRPTEGPPPVLVLVSDGGGTDDWRSALRKLLEGPWGRKAVRIAVALGQGGDTETLHAFVQGTELRPLTPRTPDALARLIQWHSETAGPAPTPASTPAPAPAPAAPPGSNAARADVW